MARQIRNAVIEEDSGACHIIARRCSQGVYYRVGGKEYEPGTLVGLETFAARDLDNKLGGAYGYTGRTRSQLFCRIQCRIKSVNDDDQRSEAVANYKKK